MVPDQFDHLTEALMYKKSSFSFKDRNPNRKQVLSITQSMTIPIRYIPGTLQYHTYFTHHSRSLKSTMIFRARRKQIIFRRCSPSPTSGDIVHDFIVTVDGELRRVCIMIDFAYCDCDFEGRDLLFGDYGAGCLGVD